MSKRLEARVHGHVQGVFFRDSTRQEAQRLGLDGWVRNEADGTVSVVAEGSEDALQELEQFLEVGPRAARVTRVDTEWGTAEGEFRGFRVRW